MSGLTPHDRHAQDVFIIKVLQRSLGDGIGFHIVHAQYTRAKRAPQAHGECQNGWIPTRHQIVPCAD
ncbi:hypothetical protein [Achromobacter animicus]|uniref:hypothetical protein n=1 Tax=Achromobacter animicus TaxID=1389935 RepID=UPI0015824236|nr:hypothetical protein [Achromobacter animicus]